MIRTTTTLAVAAALAFGGANAMTANAATTTTRTCSTAPFRTWGDYNSLPAEISHVRATSSLGCAGVKALILAIYKEGYIQNVLNRNGVDAYEFTGNGLKFLCRGALGNGISWTCSGGKYVVAWIASQVSNSPTGKQPTPYEGPGSAYNPVVSSQCDPTTAKDPAGQYCVSS